jgi:hypothetical protein
MRSDLTVQAGSLCYLGLADPDPIVAKNMLLLAPFGTNPLIIPYLYIEK